MEKQKNKKSKHQMDHAPAPSEGEAGEPHLEEEKKVGNEREIEELKKKLEEKEKEARENYDRLLRAASDLENYKKRAMKEKEEWSRFANEDLIKAVLPFIDNLERAVGHSEKTENVEGLVKGVKLTLQQFLQTLNKFGVSTFDSLGKPFDPAFHEAMSLVETNQHEPNHVVQEFQRGYLLNDRLLRPATVSVSKAPEKEAQKTE